MNIKKRSYQIGMPYSMQYILSYVNYTTTRFADYTKSAVKVPEKKNRLNIAGSR